MTKEQAGALLEGYLKPIFGFALRRCKSVQDAEDLAQEIVMKALRSLSIRDDVEDAGRFIWTIAHHTLANYYREASRQYMGLPEEVQEDPLASLEQRETIARLYREIAYLSGSSVKSSSRITLRDAGRVKLPSAFMCRWGR